MDDVDSNISASVGSSMRFRAPGEPPVPPRVTPGPPDGSMVTQIPSMVVPDQKIALRWFQVPLRYLTSPNSHLVRHKGKINQWPFMDRPIGSMLYMGPRVLRCYTPVQFAPSQQLTAPDGFGNILLGSFYSEPLADVELSFIYTARQRADVNAVPEVERPNKNWLDLGHNLMGDMHTRRYFYAHASTTPPDDYERQPPYYLSIPHQILFMDPSVPEVVLTL